MWLLISSDFSILLLDILSHFCAFTYCYILYYVCTLLGSVWRIQFMTLFRFFRIRIAAGHLCILIELVVTEKSIGYLSLEYRSHLSQFTSFVVVFIMFFFNIYDRVVTAITAFDDQRPVWKYDVRRLIKNLIPSPNQCVFTWRTISPNFCIWSDVVY